MGHDSPDFQHTVRKIVEKHSGPVDDDAIESALSRHGRFVSVTITVVAQSQEQLDAIYRDATAHADVLMAL
jgi:putative lipoic acid-binding regulatory protein